MDLRKEVSNANTPARCLRIANYIGNQRSLFSELIQIFLTDSWRINQRAANPLILCIKNSPDLLTPHISSLLANLKKNNLHDAIKRNTLRLLKDVEIPKPLRGKTAGICFELLIDNKTPIAIKVFAMMVLSNLAMQLPELKNELLIHIEDQMPYGSAGFVSRGRKIIRKLKASV